MNMNCADRERIFLDGSTEEWAALQEHAAACRECGEEVRAWRALSVTAKELQEEQQSPLLWNRIESSLREQMAQAKEPRKRIWSLLDFWRDVPMAWQTALAAVLVLALTLAGGYLYTRRSAPVNNAGNQLLKTPALAEAERTEREYTQAIDKLAVSAKPQLDSPTSPLMASYREKLMLLDGAIEELRTQAGLNPSNAHLRYQLLAMYQQKQETLVEVLETKQ